MPRRQLPDKAASLPPDDSPAADGNVPLQALRALLLIVSGCIFESTGRQAVPASQTVKLYHSNGMSVFEVPDKGDDTSCASVSRWKKISNLALTLPLHPELSPPDLMLTPQLNFAWQCFILRPLMLAHCGMAIKYNSTSLQMQTVGVF